MSLRNRCIPLDRPDQWRQALAGISHSFGHTWENCYAMSLTTGLPTYLYCFESDSVRIVCPITERRHAGVTDIAKPFGFSGFVGNGACPEFAASWKLFAREQGYVCGYLGLNPLLDYGGHFEPDEVFPYDTVHLLDLRLDSRSLWENLSSNRKRQLRGWEERSAGFIVDTTVLAEFFLANHRQFFQSRGAGQQYRFSDETLAFLFGLDRVLLVGAAGAGGVEAVSVFAWTDDVGEYLFNVSLPGGKDHGADLIWYGATRLRELGIPLFNLGGGSGGVGESKRRYGGRELPLRCIKQIYDHGRYARLCRELDIDPEERTGYFPAYHAAV